MTSNANKVIIGIVLLLVGGVSVLLFQEQRKHRAGSDAPQLPAQNANYGSVPPAETNTPAPNVASPTLPSDWKAITVPSGWSITVPPDLAVGAKADNTVLGTYDTPVTGIFVGDLVFIDAETPSLKKQAADYFDGYYQSALNPPPPGPEGLSASCSVEKINNPNATVKAVSCGGEGGKAFYALVTKNDKTIFIDGYSHGYVTTKTNFKTEQDIIQSLSSLTFTK